MGNLQKEDEYRARRHNSHCSHVHNNCNRRVLAYCNAHCFWNVPFNCMGYYIYGIRVYCIDTARYHTPPAEGLDQRPRTVNSDGITTTGSYFRCRETANCCPRFSTETGRSTTHVADAVRYHSLRRYIGLPLPCLFRDNFQADIIRVRRKACRLWINAHGRVPCHTGCCSCLRRSWLKICIGWQHINRCCRMAGTLFKLAGRGRTWKQVNGCSRGFRQYDGIY